MMHRKGIGTKSLLLLLLAIILLLFVIAWYGSLNSELSGLFGKVGDLL
jgi:hypothetical protein